MIRVAAWQVPIARVASRTADIAAAAPTGRGPRELA